MAVPFQAFSDMGFESDKNCNIGLLGMGKKMYVYVQLGILCFMCISFTVGSCPGVMDFALIWWLCEFNVQW